MTDSGAPATSPDLTSEAQSVDGPIGVATLIAITAPHPDAPSAPGASAEIVALDALWEQEWDVADERASAPQIIDIEPLPLHSVAAYRMRRLIDVVVSLIVLVVAAPVMLMIALAVRLTSTGPALFKQARPGMGGREFDVLKFRSMDAGADREVLADDALRQQYEDNDFKLPADDPRITPLGRIIRKTSLDELPQLINVLKGEMSLVGIRPLLPDQLVRRPVRDQLLYKMMRPGMTGLWQVEGRSNVAQDDRLALDRRYVLEWSVRRDLQVLARTPLALLRTTDAC